MTEPRNVHQADFTPPHLSAFEVAALAANAAESKKAKETLVLDTEKISCLASFFVICTGDTPAQIKAITEAVRKAVEGTGQELVGRERDQSSRWQLLDYGDVVIHVLHPQAREYYQLETFWSHADIVNRRHWQPQQLKEAS